ncbi:hypothetical protein [Streptomyces collinus]|uniref:Uncharacterized protein n=2 Tax=Streptomyces TaxID=1883 RepID=A0AA89QSS6_STRCU|nr:hypothetical protein [Streptomyces collinus]MBB5816784.1 hypothetical protein [Streptomyces collinus]WMX61965.1 hypothetical protein RFN52_00725 [Streptomyces collinus]
MTTPTPSGTVLSTSPWRLDAERRLLARALAESVVTEVAAEELPLFERRARSHFRPRLWRRRPLSVDILGLPTDAVTPAALSAAAGVLGVMSAELVSRLTSRLVGRVARRRRRAEVEPPEPAAPAVPAAAELARWRAAALSGALRHVSEQRAERVADSVLAELVRMLATDTTDATDTGDPAPDTDTEGDG